MTEQPGNERNPANALAPRRIEDDPADLNLVALWRLVWRGKWLIGAVTAVFAVASVAYALLATEWYEAEVLLAPVDQQTAPGLAAQFGGLASLAGIDLSDGGTAEPIAVLRSRDFVRDFIVDRKLMPVLYADKWDDANQRWLVANPEDGPDLRDAVRFFRENLLRVSEDTKTGLVTVAVEWKDAETAADWASALVERLNARMRQRALAEAEKNVAYLQSELQNVTVVAIQQSIGRLLETEMQKLMLARGNEEFSFRVIDPASPPKYRSRPRRTLLVITSTMLGGMIGLFIVLIRRLGRQQTA